MTDAFPPEKFLEEVKRRHTTLRSQVHREPETVKAIRKTVGALAGEFGRLEALYKDGDDYFIPHGEKAKLYELAVDTAALCMVLCENTVQSRRQAQLLLDCLSDTEDVMKVTQALEGVTEQVLRERKEKELQEQLEAAQRAKEDAEQEARAIEAEVKAKGKKKRGDTDAP